MENYFEHAAPVKMLCKGGPFDGKYIMCLKTLIFTARGQTGQYVYGVWHAVPKH